jgi:hypothetical protein
MFTRKPRQDAHPAADQTAGVFFAKTFRELTARFLQQSNFALLRARYVLTQRSSPWGCSFSAKSIALSRHHIKAPSNGAAGAKITSVCRQP